MGRSKEQVEATVRTALASPCPKSAPTQISAGIMGEAELLIRVPRHLFWAAIVLALPSNSPLGHVLMILWEDAQAEPAG